MTDKTTLQNAGSDHPVPYSQLVIGINGGGTRTSFALVDSALNVLARADAGPSNPNVVGVEAATASLRAGIDDLTRTTPLDRIAAIGAGISGVDRPNDRRQMIDLFTALYPNQQLVLDNDAMPALVAAVGRPYGIVIISGTGMIALGANERGERTRSGGWGHYVDHGGGYSIAREALSALAAAHDGSGPATALTDRILARLELKSSTEIIAWLYAPGRRIDQVAGLASEVVDLADSGDLVVTRILFRAARALAKDTANVARRLGFVALDARPFPVLMSGGILTNCALLRDLFTSALQTDVPNAVTMLTDRDAALGAAMMALSALGVAVPEQPLPGGAGQDRRVTERRNRLTMAIGNRSALDLVTIMNIEDERLPEAIARQLPQIAALIEAIAPRYVQGGRLIYVGAGTSGRLAVLDAAECRPTFSTTLDEVVGIIAGGPEAMLHSVEGAEDDESGGGRIMIDRQVGPLDTVIGVAASGSTPFVRGALREARSRGALTGCVVNAMHAPISALVEHPIVVPVGPEVLTGSTRLKSGSAQKIALNMISTGLMIRIGRTYHNLMTDMQSSNIKLRGRARSIVAEATGLSLEDAGALLDRCGGEMKTAIAAALLGLEPDQARAQLAQARGNLNTLIRS